ncbi:FAD:protein FMN transferase [Pelosinus sp. sgz500959]|uniref:FAD:protein FMN transferase n=1 Tax=Pelosinus sp. sgz500959 TaxID=3242472 RepID=UPI0036729BA7
MKKLRSLVSVVLIFIVAFSIIGCSPMSFLSPKPYKETQFLMDTIIEITAYGSNNESAVKAAFDEFKRIQEISDKYNPESQISKINQMAGISPVEVSPDLIKMINYSIEISKKMDGAFDISIGSLTELWGIGHKEEFVPTQEEINGVLPLVDYRMIQVNANNGTVYLPKVGMKLDLGGVAKDYALNKGIEILKSYGIKSALLNAGGDIQVIGTKPDGNPWRIGVQDPRNSEGVIAKVTLDPWNTVQTSGDYQRFFIKNGVRYAHILNPKTGRQPIEIASVTLVYKDADVYTTGDIASSGFIVLGLEKSMEVLKKFPGVEGIFVTTDGKVVVTPGLKDKVELSK